jgi:hypothetical protein
LKVKRIRKTVQQSELNSEMKNKSTTIKLSPAATQLLDLVPPDGVFIGNTTLQRRSKLGKRYWQVRGELVSGGFVTRGKGRGGSVARLAAEAEAVFPTTRTGKGFVRKESELYEPLRRWLADVWGEGVEPGDFFEVITTGTARNKKRASGQWSRPDVTLVQVNSYDYLPQPVLEVTTFEVKRFSDAENIRSVYEAAAHSRWAHFSYLVAEVPSSDYEFPERFVSELERFNLGLIFMWKDRKAKGGWEFEEREWETDRLNPEPEELNALLKGFFQDSKRAREFKLALGKG